MHGPSWGILLHTQRLHAFRQLVEMKRESEELVGAGDEEDPVENMLKRTGCIELHYKVQECIASTQDWRKCQTEVNEFRACMTKHQQRRDK